MAGVIGFDANGNVNIAPWEGLVDLTDDKAKKELQRINEGLKMLTQIGGAEWIAGWKDWEVKNWAQREILRLLR